MPADSSFDVVSQIDRQEMVNAVDQVTREWVSMYEQVPSEYITLIFHYAQQPKDDVLRELEAFMTKVVPELDAAGSPRASKAKPRLAAAAE